MKRSHTPAPWFDTRSERFPEWLIHARGAHICTVQWTEKGARACDANARLIAAAPELLTALRRAHYFMSNRAGLDNGSDFPEAFRSACAAIHKATGEVA